MVRKVSSQAHRFMIEENILYFVNLKHHHRKRAALFEQLGGGIVAEARSGPYVGHFCMH